MRAPAGERPSPGRVHLTASRLAPRRPHQATTDRHRTDSMRKSVGEARRAAGRLFLAYTLASLLPLLALAGALVQDLRREAVRPRARAGTRPVAVVEEMAIAPALSGADLREGLSMAEREMLQDATDLAVFRGSLVRLRLRDFDGSVVYSDDGTTVDGAAVDSRAFRDASRGVLDVTVQPDPVDGTGKRHPLAAAGRRDGERPGGRRPRALPALRRDRGAVRAPAARHVRPPRLGPRPAVAGARGHLVVVLAQPAPAGAAARAPGAARLAHRLRTGRRSSPR